MKKNIFFILFLVFPLLQCFSQKMKVGLDIGTAYASFRGSDIIDGTKSEFGSMGGVSFEYFLTSHFSLKSNLNLENKNNSYSGIKNVFSIDYEGKPILQSFNIKNKNSYKYLALSTMAKYYFGKNSSFFINGGFFYARLNKYDVETDIKEIPYIEERETQRTNYPLAEAFDGSDYGLVFGIGKSFSLNDKFGLSIEVRDNLGLRNVIEGTVRYSASGDIKTNSVNLLLGFEMKI
jgi:hypothetical protein